MTYIVSAQSNSYSAFFPSFQPATDALLEAYKDEDGAWLAPVVALFITRLRVLAAQVGRFLSI
jgi:hypothetical protein